MFDLIYDHEMLKYHLPYSKAMLLEVADRVCDLEKHCLVVGKMWNLSLAQLYHCKISVESFILRGLWAGRSRHRGAKYTLSTPWIDEPHVTRTLFWLNAGPTSVTLAQHSTRIVSPSRLKYPCRCRTYCQRATIQTPGVGGGGGSALFFLSRINHI